MIVWYIFMQFPAPSETFACGDVKSLLRKNIDISVFTLRKKQKFADKMLCERDLVSLPVSYSDYKSYLKGLLILFFNPIISYNLITWIFSTNISKPKDIILSLLLLPRVLEVFSLIRKIEPDVLHLFWGHYPSMLGFLVDKYCKKVVLSMFLGAYDLERKYFGSRYLLPKADIVFTHSKYNIDLINCLANEKLYIEVVYRGFDFSVLENFKISKQENKVIIVGNLIESKGVDDSIRVFAKIHDCFPSARLIICGDGPQRKNIMDLCIKLDIENFVTFMGHVSHLEVLRQISSSKLLILMSRKQSDRLPNVIKEAMAFKTICITTNTPGIRELIPDDSYGFVAQMSDIQFAAKYSLNVFNYDFDSDSIANNAYNHLIKNFDIDKCMSTYISRWRYLIAKKKEAVSLLEDE
jgi:glycosyltransferase involved in cell wall biosynthesis